MLSLTAYSDARREEWDRLALSAGTIFHTIAFRDLLAASFGYRPAYHAVTDGEGGLRALIPLIVGRSLGLKKAGVALPFVNHLDICAVDQDARRFALAALPAITANLGLDYLELRLKDQDTTAAGPGWRAHLDNYTFVLPLTGGEDAVLALSAASNRNHVRKAYKNGWFTASFDTGRLDAFYGVYRQRMKQLGSPAPDIRFFERFFSYLPDHAHLLTALDNASGAVVGGMLLLASPGDATLYYPYGAGRVEYNGKYLNSFMYWEAARLGIKLGLRHLDLGRSPAGSGTYRYKEQWGAKAEQLKYLVYAGGGDGPPERGRLSLFVDLWKVVPAFVTDRLGHFVIKHVMP